jgi:hypothetical protein
VTETVRAAATDAVNLGYTVVERQIHEGQRAADRLRERIATSQDLNTDMTMMVENLVSTTRNLGETWLKLMSLVLGSIAPQAGSTSASSGTRLASSASSQAGTASVTTFTTTKIATSGRAKTTSSIAAAGPAGSRVPFTIMVKGGRATDVTLDLRPTFEPFTPQASLLLGTNPNKVLRVRFATGANHGPPVLIVKIPRGLPSGTYTGAVVDSNTNKAGGTVSVAVGK